MIFILGAGSLQTGEMSTSSWMTLKNAGFLSWINTPRQQLKELSRAITDVDWSGFRQPATFTSQGRRQATNGKDKLLYNGQGESKVTTGTMAEVIVKSSCRRFHQERFTVVNTGDKLAEWEGIYRTSPPLNVRKHKQSPVRHWRPV